MSSKQLLEARVSKRTLVQFSLLFLLTCGLIYTYYFLSGGSFVWESDGFTQHLQLFDEYVKALQGFLRGEGFSHWNWSIGAGADTISSYGYYVIGDPFVYLGVLFPEALREFSFHLLIFLRMWCVGLSYLIFVKKFKVSHGAGLLGAVMYTFSFFVILNVNRHPFFILPMIWLPLLCLGVEKILRGESGLVFSIMVAVSAIANFYFFYKLTVLIFLFGIVRYWTLHGFKDPKAAFRSFFRCLIHYGLGVLISAVIFLPMVGGFLTGARSADGLSINLLVYHLGYYLAFIHNLFVPDSYLWTVGGFSIISIFTVIYLAKVRKSFPGIMVGILTLMLLFPFIGSFMNGMSGPYNRFSFAVPFFLALGSGALLENRQKLEARDLRIGQVLLVVFTLIYGLAAYLQDMQIYYIVPVLIGWTIWYLLKIENDTGSLKPQVSLGLIGLVTLNLATNAMGYYYDYGRNSIETSVELGTAIDQYRNTLGGAEAYLPEADLYRVGVSSQDGHIRNQFIYHDLMGLSSYLSITNGSLSDFAQEMDLASYQIIQPLRNGMDDRRWLNHLMGIEYIITEAENANYLPQGYDIIEQTGGSNPFIVAQTQASFPLAYIQDTVISSQEFKELSPLEKESYLMQGAVLEEEDMERGVFSSEYQALDSLEVPYQLAGADTNVQLDGNTVKVQEDSGGFTLLLENTADLDGYDLFVDLNGIDYQTANTSSIMPDQTGYDIRFYYGDRRKSYRQSDVYTFSTYFERNRYFVNLGEMSQDANELTINFADPGNYEIGDIRVYAVPVDTEADQALAEAKRSQALDIDRFEDDFIAGSLPDNQGGLLTTSIPYEMGWQVMVDGEEVDTLKTNIGFIGVPLEAGASDLTFTYRNPYIDFGKIISLVGIVLLIGLEVYWRYPKKH